ncbi:MAG: hypothetical protein H6Q33_5142, partial [Deltaproteobacteria bacterium]|nr:hypothetical protein [Deltaproteobacteria bacterium]
GVGAALQRLGLARPGFVDSGRHDTRRFFTMVGQAHRIEVERRSGLRAAQQLYRATAA